MTSAGESCKTDKSNFEGEIAELKKDKHSLDIRISQLEKQLNTEHASLTAQTAEVDSQIADLTKQLSAANVALNSMTEEHEACKGREHECVSEKDKHAKDVARLTAELEAVMTQKTSLQEQVQALTAQSGDQT